MSIMKRITILVLAMLTALSLAASGAQGQGGGETAAGTNAAPQGEDAA